jgi:hypothetical protein
VSPTPAATDTSGDTEPAVKARPGLARAQLQLGDPVAALAMTVVRPELPFPAEEPAMRCWKGWPCSSCTVPGRACGRSVTRSRPPMRCWHSRTGTSPALQARALALSGLATTGGDPDRVAEAGEAFVLARAVTSAAGVAADTRRLLDKIACHDRSGILAGVRAAGDL